MAKCLVLGANGFLGSHLTDALVSRGYHIIAFDRFTGSVERFVPHPSITIFAGDFLNRSDLARALHGVDYVFHFISTTTPASVEEDPLIDIETNIRMSVELFQECVNAKVKSVIFASTGGSIYGTNSSTHVREDDLPLPISPYAIGKLTIEHYLRYFNIKYGLRSVVFRVSNPYGERQSLVSKQGVIPIFLQHIARHEPLTILGDGTMVRDYLYVKDFAAMVAEAFVDAKDSVYNLGSGRGLSVNELVMIMRRVTGQEIRIVSSPKPTTFVDRVVLDTSRFKREFKDTPSTPLDEGVRATWRYVQEQVERGV